MNQDKTHYIASDFFLARFALLPFSSCNLSAEDLFDLYQKTPLFQEAIAIASPSLHQSLQQLNSGQGDKKKIFFSLLKYFLRASTRATPFGLFSAVAWGRFSNTSDLSFSRSSLDKHVQLDREWLKAMIDTLQNEIQNVRNLKVMTNPLILKSGKRVFLISKNATTNHLESCSIKSSQVSDTIFHLSKEPIVYSELEEKLALQFNTHPKEKTSDYLWQLFQKGYLLSEFSLRFQQTSPISEDELTKKYNDAPFGQGLKELLLCLEKCPKDPKISYSLQVDCFKKGRPFSLSSKIQKDVETAASLLWLLTNTSPYPFLQNYHRFFLEKYGLYRLVPALELIDPHLGLGMPERLPQPQNEGPSLSWKNLLLSHVKDREIHLEALQEFPVTQDKIESAPLSVEIFFQIIASSQSAIDKGEYRLVVNSQVASTQAGSTFGRFLYLFDSPHKQELREFLKKEEALESESLFVEASFLPYHPRTANVAFHEKLRDYQLYLHFHDPSPQTLALDDIYVGATITHFYLFSKRLQKKVILTLSSAVNTELAPPILKLLLEISQSNLTQFSPFLWEGFRNEPFLPRVSYQNIILSSARWYFNGDILRLKNDASRAEVKTALERNFQTYQLPDRVYLVHFDNKILVMWKDPGHFQLILQQFLDKKEIAFTESLETMGLLQSEQGHHIAEFVVPCIRKEPKALKNPIFYPPTQLINRENRLFPPGSPWLFFKIFTPEMNEEALLKKEIPFLIQILKNSCSLTKWFYIRYKEEKSHLRLRFQCSREAMPLTCQILSSWMKDSLIGDYSIHTYEREIERYGGNIEIAETLFWLDSELSIEILKNLKAFDLPLDAIAAINLLHIIRSFYPTTQDQIDFLAPSDKNRNLLAGFRNHGKKALEYTLHPFFEKFRDMEPWIQKFDEIGYSWIEKRSIVESFVHMHCNRLLGLNEEREKKAQVIASYLLQKRVHESCTAVL